MKAYVLNNINQLEYMDVSIPTLSEGMALIKVKACGICSSDIPRIFVNGTYHFPTIPGHEFSGIVEDVYDNDYKNIKGKLVGVFPLIPCKKCPNCIIHKYEMCDNYNYLGSRCNGGFAEYVVVPVWNLIELSENISFEEAAMLEPLAVAYHAIKMLNVNENEKLAIVGTGMIGLAEAYIASLKGADVTIIVRNENKIKYIKKIPNVKYILKDNINDIKFDKVIEAVGSSEAINLSIEIVNTNGMVVLMGNPNDDITLMKNIYWKILRKQLTISGSWNSSYEHNAASDWKSVVDLLQKKIISPKIFISHIFPQEKVMEGLKIMLNKKESYCKIITLWNQ